MTYRRAGAEADAGRNDPLAWQEKALCAQANPEAFFPDKGGSAAAAKRVCRACPVAAECLEFALAGNERFGVWGGLSERERRRIKGDSVPRRCRAGLHDMTGANTTDGRCRECRNASDRERRRMQGLAA
jgi:WhiB family transcriptional regulator, redox-sensing transcriptional regulator